MGKVMGYIRVLSGTEFHKYWEIYGSIIHWAVDETEMVKRLKDAITGKKAGTEKRGEGGFREFFTFDLFTNWLLRYEIITSLYEINFYVEHVLFWNIMSLVFGLIYGGNLISSYSNVDRREHVVIAPHGDILRHLS